MHKAIHIVYALLFTLLSVNFPDIFKVSPFIHSHLSSYMSLPKGNFLPMGVKYHLSTTVCLSLLYSLCHLAPNKHACISLVSFLFHIIGGDLSVLGLSVLFNDIYTSRIYNTYCYMVDTQ